MMKLSIITINRNNAEGLLKTIQSVFCQNYRDFEYIIVDGASEDESLHVIHKCLGINDANMSVGEKIIHGIRVSFVSEVDSGIYDAMNKGLRRSHGEYSLMLNSGDYLVDSSVIGKIIPELYDEDFIQGNVIEDYPDGSIRYRAFGHSDLTFLEAFDGNFPHQATFIKFETMKRYGFYDDSYKKGADTYFFINALALSNATYRYVDIDISNFNPNGISSMRDPKWQKIDIEEDTRWYGTHVPRRLLDFYPVAKKYDKWFKSLHRYKLIWNIVMFFVKLSDWMYAGVDKNREKI